MEKSPWKVKKPRRCIQEDKITHARNRTMKNFTRTGANNKTSEAADTTNEKKSYCTFAANGKKSAGPAIEGTTLKNGVIKVISSSTHEPNHPPSKIIADVTTTCNATIAYENVPPEDVVPPTHKYDTGRSFAANDDNDAAGTPISNDAPSLPPDTSGH